MVAYHKELGILTSSSVQYLLKSPAHYRAYIEGEEEETPALIFGKALHKAVLQPDVFRSEYVELPDFGDQRYSINKKAKADFESKYQNSQVKFITTNEFRLINSMVCAINKNVDHRLINRKGIVEETIYWEVDGVKHRATPDKYVSGVCLDLKTTEDASNRMFSYSVEKYGYAIQAAHYLDGLNAVGRSCKEFLFVVVEKSPPFGVAIYNLSHNKLDRAREQIERARATLKQCMATNEWPCYSRDIQTIGE